MNNINKANKYMIYPKIGDKFNYLIVIAEPFIKRYENSDKNMAYITCECQCGNVQDFPLSRVKRGDIKSCGCKRTKYTKNIIYHGDYKSKLYHIWQGMKQRCYNKKSNQFYLYGNKGIKICEQWLNYIEFKKWSNNHGFKDGLSIDRIDSSKDYCPENCEWVTKSENSSRVVSGRDKQIKFLTEENNKLKEKIKELENQLIRH